MRKESFIFSIGSSLLLLFVMASNVKAQTSNNAGFESDLSETLNQIGLPYLYENKGLIRIWANAYTQSNSVPIEFSNAFIFPDFISEQMKTSAYERLKEKNRFGGEFNRGVELTFSPDSTWKSEGKFLSFRYKSSTLFGAEFGEDLFKLIFSGNKQFQNASASLSETQLLFNAFETFEIGFLKTGSKSISSFSFGLVKGNQYTSINLDEGSLFTSQNGDYLDLSWDGNYVQSSGGNKLNNNPSVGASLNLKFVQQLGSKWILRESIEDFGFTVFNSNTRTAKMDTAFRFTGIQLGSLFDISDSTIIVGDTLEQKILGNDVRQTQMIALPVDIQVGLTRLFNHRLSVGLNVRYRYIPGFIPLTEASVSKSFGKNRSVRLMLSYGGFGGIQSGVSAVVFSNHHHSLRIGSFFNEGFISPRKLSGAGLQLNYVHHI